MAAARVFLFGVAVAVVVLIAYWAIVYTLQRRLIFPRPLTATNVAPGPGVERHWLRIGGDSARDGVAGAAGDRIEVWHLPATPPSARRPLLIFTHGNGEVIDLWPEAFEPLRQQGVGALLVEYPGYGRSEGTPSQSAITEAVVAAYDLAVDELGYPAAGVFAYGRSIGGGAASALATRRPVAGLILESSFSSIAAMAGSYLVPAFLIRDPFDNVAAVAAFDGPVLVLHGARDTLIPVDHGRRLAAAARRSELHLMPCGHNDCPRPWDRVLEFVGAAH
jgi:pimeloyl-ACP methyl ester carboxylesterase